MYYLNEDDESLQKNNEVLRFFGNFFVVVECFFSNKYMYNIIGYEKDTNFLYPLSVIGLNVALAEVIVLTSRLLHIH